MPLSLGSIILLKEKGGMRQSFPRQIDKKTKGAQEREVWNSQGGRKDKLFFSPLLSLVKSLQGLYNNNVSCLRTVSGLNLLANLVIIKCKLWEQVW